MSIGLDLSSVPAGDSFGLLANEVFDSTLFEELSGLGGSDFRSLRFDGVSTFPCPELESDFGGNVNVILDSGQESASGNFI
jgi:hypothetical protein